MAEGPRESRRGCGRGPMRGIIATRPPAAGTERPNLGQDLFALAVVLGGGKAGLELVHLLLTVVTAFQFHAAFDHRDSPRQRGRQRRVWVRDTGSEAVWPRFAGSPRTAGM